MDSSRTTTNNTNALLNTTADLVRDTTLNNLDVSMDDNEEEESPF